MSEIEISIPVVFQVDGEIYTLQFDGEKLRYKDGEPVSLTKEEIQWILKGRLQ